MRFYVELFLVFFRIGIFTLGGGYAMVPLIEREVVENKKWLDAWVSKITTFPFSLQKMEWNCKGESRIIRDHILQFRASGLRVKRSTTAPALIAMTTTQVPIIGRDNRFMTIRECSRLQGMGELKHLPATEERAYRALGNAVNADIVEQIGMQLEKLLKMRKMEIAV